MDWKSELRKIDTLDPSPELLARARRGPQRGEPQPPTGRRIAVAVVGLAIAGLALGLVVIAFGTGEAVRPAGSPSAVAAPEPMPWMAVLKERPVMNMQALYSGSLIERDGCLMMEDERALPVWPMGFSVARSGDGVQVVNEDGQPVGSLSGGIRMGGGYFPWRGSLAALQDSLEEPIPAACLQDLRNVWMVGETHPLPPTLTPKLEGLLLDRAGQFAAANGDPKSVRTYAVVTDGERLGESNLGGKFNVVRLVPDEPWVVVQVYGEFICHSCKVREDAEPPTGDALWFAMHLSDPLPGEVFDWGVVAVPFDLERLGDPVRIDLIPTKAPPLQVTPPAPARSLECPPGTTVTVGHTDFIQGAKGEVGDPVDLVSGLRGVRITDLVEAFDTGGPGDSVLVSVTRDGNVVMIVHLRSDGQGGWLRDRVDSCT